MKKTAFVPALLAGLAGLAVSAVAVAQPSGPPGPPPPPPGNGGYYAQPAPNGGFMHAGGRMTLGISLGLGVMKADSGPIDCGTCDYNPAAAGIAMHIGGMINPRLAIMLELQGNVQTVDQSGGYNTSLVQSAAMVAGQYWATPKLWVKGGIGAAQLSFNYDDGYQAQSEEIDRGTAVMAAVGYELLSAPRYSIDLQARALVGSYDGIGDQITAGHIGVGFNWY